MQIEKITNQNQIARHKLAGKINELVDAVNELQKQIDKAFFAILDLATPDCENKALKSIQADQYAEQRKWIGTLCRCWDSDINDDIWGILQDIKDNKTEKYYLYGIGYEHCEPVKPDDDIIYKGSDND